MLVSNEQVMKNYIYIFRTISCIYDVMLIEEHIMQRCKQSNMSYSTWPGNASQEVRACAEAIREQAYWILILQLICKCNEHCFLPNPPIFNWLRNQYHCFLSHICLNVYRRFPISLQTCYLKCTSGILAYFYIYVLSIYLSIHHSWVGLPYSPKGCSS